MHLLRRLVLPLVGLLGATLALVACPLLPDRDNFVCGIRANSTITRCDGPGELCLCGGQDQQSKNRCATPEDSSICSSGFRYTFAEDDDGDGCVPKELLEHYVTADSSALCDSTGEVECGMPTSNGSPLRCGYNQFCYCPSRRCAEPWPDCAENGGLPARFISSKECVGSHDGGLDEVRELPDGTCPGYQLDDLFPDGGSGDAGQGATDGGSDAGQSTEDAGSDGGSGDGGSLP